jgi:hypothetical protein
VVLVCLLRVCDDGRIDWKRDEGGDDVPGFATGCAKATKDILLVQRLLRWIEGMQCGAVLGYGVSKRECFSGGDCSGPLLEGRVGAELRLVLPVM